MAMTLAMPMTIPSIVRNVRTLFLRRQRIGSVRKRDGLKGEPFA